MNEQDIIEAIDGTNGYKYQDNYLEGGLTRKGRQVLITDEGGSYAYPLAEYETMQIALDSFLETYDIGDADGGTINVHEYRDGICVDSLPVYSITRIKSVEYRDSPRPQ